MVTADAPTPEKKKQGSIYGFTERKREANALVTVSNTPDAMFAPLDVTTLATLCAPEAPTLAKLAAPDVPPLARLAATEVPSLAIEAAGRGTLDTSHQTRCFLTYRQR